ncbi:hypothetical protein [Rufibacter quisquiliarum]|uniref:Uncharacterized protein n=1 Tax=Rufibacter quisquiliarum TaxID=1549639 RepID=A0A839GAW6_9BACT|nr:hypothetical protein [Rufibacter quisquiliarum]MBA9076072.1 hypothetical protein [Rufibacter quisquiliarum]
MEGNKDLEQGTPGGAPANSPEAAKAQEPAKTDKAKKPEDPRVKECLNALAAFPVLEEGYICKKGIYFDKEVAESKLESGEKLIVIKRPKK